MGCIGCKICIKTCPEANATKFITPKKKVIINPMRCKGCGLCVDVCPMKCITLNSI
ncbi:4Fe-4S dicluster domain-containing protein [Peptococcaceae bacterium]|nr:4Fe-4S dicluster domain-containing protein [Peptococcaceae bacterium]